MYLKKLVSTIFAIISVLFGYWLLEKKCKRRPSPFLKGNLGGIMEKKRHWKLEKFNFNLTRQLRRVFFIWNNYKGRIIRRLNLFINLSILVTSRWIFLKAHWSEFCFISCLFVEKNGWDDEPREILWIFEGLWIMEKWCGKARNSQHEAKKRAC